MDARGLNPSVNVRSGNVVNALIVGRVNALVVGVVEALMVDVAVAANNEAVAPADTREDLLR